MLAKLDVLLDFYVRVLDLDNAGDGRSDFFNTLKSDERIGLGDGCCDNSDSVMVMNCMSSPEFCASTFSELNTMD